ncbi:FAD-dependent oxidoreductase [Pantoea sp. At-9b]|uniref:oxidoreductase n=1 Tax=Pantoea sp. (strain At-9b) TaxID=592316 RepID=UPI001CC19D2E|nr:FAD-dependent oxidoreductase [Pantoea sp. At-9b]
MRKMNTDILFEKVQIGPLLLKNRFVMAPMSVHMTHDGSVTAEEIAFYERRAQGGSAMLIVGSVCIKPDGDFGGQLYIDRDECIPGLKALTDAVHQYDCLISAQIHHSGRETSINVTGHQPVAPSYFEPEVYSIFKAEYSPPRELSTAEVAEYVEYYAQAVWRAKQAGFDSVELHGAHGYLICAFMSPLTNKRTDRYGGSFLGRMQFINEIMSRSRALVGDEYPITIRIVGDECREGGIDPHLSVRIAQHLEQLGFAAISVSAGMYPYIRTVPNTYHKKGVNLYLAENIRDAVSIPVMAAGQLSSPDIQTEAIVRKKADLIALGRALIADPDYPNKLKLGALDDIVFCIACNKGCHDRTAGERAVKCMLNVQTGRETLRSYDITPAAQSRKIMIIGGGPAGMEAARVAALRGHQVSLFDAGADIGGKIVQSALAPGKESYLEVLAYYRRQLAKPNIKIHTGYTVTREDIARSGSDAVIIATGSLDKTPVIAGLQPEKMLSAQQAFLFPQQVGQRAVIIGGGAVGAELAHYIMSVRKVEIYVIDPQEYIAHGMPQDSRICLLDELNMDTQFHTISQARVSRIDDDRVYYQQQGSEHCIDGIDSIIISTGSTLNNALKNSDGDVIKNLKIIGDAEKPGDMVKAIRQGYEAALAI